MKSVISASYLCDFGNVIQGLKRKRMFKIFNATASGKRVNEERGRGRGGEDEGYRLNLSGR
jgi:hypothetical protein